MALSAARVQKRQNNPMLVSVKMAASTSIYQGGGVMFNSSGLAVPAADTASCTRLGVAMETKTSASTGDYYISVAVSGVFNFKAAAAAAATWHGLPVFWSDDETVALAATTSHDILAGVCVSVNSATDVDVMLLQTSPTAAN